MIALCDPTYTEQFSSLPFTGLTFYTESLKVFSFNLQIKVILREIEAVPECSIPSTSRNH